MREADRAPKAQGAGLKRAAHEEIPPYVYEAYGLVIRSDLALPELRPSEAAEADVEIRLRPIERSLPEANMVVELGDETQYLAWREVGHFVIREGREITIDPAPNASEGLLRLPLLGTVMAMLLHFRGLLVLHASGVAIGATSAVFLGDKTAGKSTIAGALVACGHRLLADDVLALQFKNEHLPKILPAFPQLKLDVAAAEKIFEVEASDLPPLFQGSEKRQHRVPAVFTSESVPPTRIYVLARGNNASLRPLHVQDALTSLIRFSYTTRFGRSGLLGRAAVHFQQCATLANAVGVAELEVPVGLERVAEAVELVQNDLQASSGTFRTT